MTGVALDQRSDGVVVVVMDWPEKRNALGPEDTRAVGDASQTIASAAAYTT